MQIENYEKVSLGNHHYFIADSGIRICRCVRNHCRADQPDKAMTDELHFGTAIQQSRIDELMETVARQEATIEELQKKLRELEDLIEEAGRLWKR